MQWSDEKHAGFSSGEPWLPVADGYESVNVAAEEEDERSLLALYRRLLVVLNLGSEPQSFDLRHWDAGSHLLLSTSLDRQGEEIQDALELRGDEGVLLEL